MARQFNVPTFYRSPIISRVKEARRVMDPRKKDLTPSTLDFGPLRVQIARHFGFCYGVENAIEIAYQAVEENPEKAAAGRIFLLSEMIHNPHVNDDLQRRGVRFLRTTKGEQLIPFDDLGPDDVVIIPAFGASREIEAKLAKRGIDIRAYDTTCPFVEKVWKRSAQIGGRGYTIVVHGKRYHEETRATISRAKADGPVVVVRDMKEAEWLAQVIRGEKDAAFFYERFPDRYTSGFDPARDLQRVGVVNQTTMLASETQAIADLMQQAIVARDGEALAAGNFADTRDTLCYATNENQNATQALIEAGGDVAIIVGGFNSSNTSHLVELCEGAMPTYFVRGAEDVISRYEIRHFDIHEKTIQETTGWLPFEGTRERPLTVVLTAGASCPDALLDEVMNKLLDWHDDVRPLADVLAPFS